jgi:hypothetical protein
MRRICVRTCVLRNFVRGVLFSPCIWEINSSYRDSDTSYCNWGIYWVQETSNMVPVIKVVLLPGVPKRPWLILLDFLSKNFGSVYLLFVLSFLVFHEPSHINLRALLFSIYLSTWMLTIESCVALRRGYILRSVVRRFRRCANVIDFTYPNLDGLAYYILRLYSIAYCS